MPLQKEAEREMKEVQSAINQKQESEAEGRGEDKRVEWKHPRLPGKSMESSTKPSVLQPVLSQQRSCISIPAKLGHW